MNESGKMTHMADMVSESMDHVMGRGVRIRVSIGGG